MTNANANAHFQTPLPHKKRVVYPKFLDCHSIKKIQPEGQGKCNFQYGTRVFSSISTEYLRKEYHTWMATKSDEVKNTVKFNYFYPVVVRNIVAQTQGRLDFR